MKRLPPKNTSRGDALLYVIIAIFVLLVLSAFHVFQPLTQNQTSSTQNLSKIEIFGSSVSGNAASSRVVQLRLVYIPPGLSPAQKTSMGLPSPVRSIASTGASTVYAAGCNPSGGIDPNTWTLIEQSACDPGNPGTAGQEWACFGSDGKPQAITFSYDAENLAKCPLPPPPACLPGCCGGANNLCSTCPNGQSCTISNGACVSGLSCDPKTGTIPPPPACLPGCCGGANNLCSTCPNGQLCRISNGACISGLSCDPATGTPPSTTYSMQIDVRDARKVPSVEQAALLGTKWVRFVFPCMNPPQIDSVCPSDWHSTNLINTLPAGIKKIGIITADSTWDAPIGSTDVSVWERYVDYVYLPALRQIMVNYGSQLDAVELWNEEDINDGPSYDPYIPPAAYAYMVSRAAAAVKSTNPNMKVITGGLASGNVSYLHEVYAADNMFAAQVDAIGIHPYKPPPSVNQVSSEVNNLYDEIYLDRINRPIWVTEIGIQQYNNTTSPKNQKEFLINVFNQFNGLSVRPPLVNWYAFSDFMGGVGGGTNWGLVDENGNVKDVGNAFYSYASTGGSSLGSVGVLYPTAFKIANSLTELTQAPAQTMSVNGQELYWQLSAGNGLKTIYAQFLVQGTWQPPISANILLQSSS